MMALRAFQKQRRQWCRECGQPVGHSTDQHRAEWEVEQDGGRFGIPGPNDRGALAFAAGVGWGIILGVVIGSVAILIGAYLWWALVLGLAFVVRVIGF
jgi:hypothetical protein